ncbi:MAG TPA: hypothetical protein VFC71_03455 [Candidatus Polarisedimenticolia bacterium]|nr:hypothetical protein [Candidatus Polarisedimenticolia bacterium]
MKRRRFLLVAAIAAISAFGGAAVTSAHTLVDPTSLTPPLLPHRVCYEAGRFVKCDTSGSGEWANEPIDDFELPCGTIYETAADTVHSTRWYENLLLVERDGQQHVSGTWTLSPTGAGSSVGFAADYSWHETFLVPGDLSSDSEVVHGSFLRIPALGAAFHENGIGTADGTDHGHLNSFTDEAKARLCELFVPLG